MSPLYRDPQLQVRKTYNSNINVSSWCVETTQLPFIPNYYIIDCIYNYCPDILLHITNQENFIIKQFIAVSFDDIVKVIL